MTLFSDVTGMQISDCFIIVKSSSKVFIKQFLFYKILDQIYHRKLNILMNYGMARGSILYA